MPTAVGPDNNADGEPEGEDDALADSGFGSSAPSRFWARAAGGGRTPADTVGGTHGGVSSRQTTIPCLDSVVAAVKYQGWAVAGVGSEAEQELGVGSWLIPEVVRMAH